MPTLITVVVPVYNVESYLKKCVTSICNQTYAALEIILVDDGSTDSSGKICDNLAMADPRTKVLHKKNGGLSEARNYGIAAARGEYIAFIDSDDYIEVSMLETLFSNLDKYNADISVCAYDMEYPQQSAVISEGNSLIVYAKEEAFKVLLHKNNIGVIPCNKLYKTSLFHNVRYPVGQHFEDINTTYKLIANAAKIVYEPKVFYHYVQRTDSINGINFKNKTFNKKLYDMELAADELQKYISVHCKPALPEISIGCCDYYLRIINQEILFKINNPVLQKKARHIIKKYLPNIINAYYLSYKKKLQMLMFGYLWPIYKLAVKNLKR